MLIPRIILYVFIILFSFLGSASAQKTSLENYGKEIPPPEYFGKVLLSNHTRKAGVDPVVFDHWLHRAKFTCRICHIDIGFAMKSNATDIKAVDNMNGYYCGSCHDGKRVVDDKKIFAACAEEYTEEEGKRCARCHSVGTTSERKYDFQTFTKKLPRLQHNQIDWEKAEEEGLIKSIDSLEGVTFQTDRIQAQKDFSIKSRSWRKPDVLFSHKKHVFWNGCAVCHPAIFPSAEKGTVQYSMFQIIDGEYCGACHLKVAFSVWLCSKCHQEQVQLR
jgi:c(7)-type cytochrome triheme protein